MPISNAKKYLLAKRAPELLVLEHLKEAEDKNLAIFDSIQEVHETLKSIDEKCGVISEKEIPKPKAPIVQVSETDMSETNDLLRKLVDKDTEITVNLKIE